MLPERRIPVRSPQWREMYERVQVAMELTSRLNVVPFSDVETRHALLGELLGDPHPEKSFVFPPFYCTTGIGTRLGARVSVGQACSFWTSVASLSGTHHDLPKGHANHGRSPDRAERAVRVHHGRPDRHRSECLDRSSVNDPSWRHDRTRLDHRSRRGRRQGGATYDRRDRPGLPGAPPLTGIGRRRRRVAADGISDSADECALQRAAAGHCPVVFRGSCNPKRRARCSNDRATRGGPTPPDVARSAEMPPQAACSREHHHVVRPATVPRTIGAPSRGHKASGLRYGTTDRAWTPPDRMAVRTARRSPRSNRSASGPLSSDVDRAGLIRASHSVSSASRLPTPARACWSSSRAFTGASPRVIAA